MAPPHTGPADSGVWWRPRLLSVVEHPPVRASATLLALESAMLWASALVTLSALESAMLWASALVTLSALELATRSALGWSWRRCRRRGRRHGRCWRRCRSLGLHRHAGRAARDVAAIPEAHSDTVRGRIERHKSTLAGHEDRERRRVIGIDCQGTHWSPATPDNRQYPDRSRKGSDPAAGSHCPCRPWP